MKKQSILFALLILAIAATVACGNSTSSFPKFTKLAFLSTRSSTTALFIAGLDGANVAPIPFSTTNTWSLSSSADGKKVAFIANGDIWVGNSDGTGQAQITQSLRLDWARISPDGKKILYNAFRANSNLMNVDGTGVVAVTLPANAVACQYGSFSADSKQVVLACFGSAAGIYTVKNDGTSPKTVALRTNYSAYPFFTPDGKKVIFDGDSATAKGIFSVNLDGTGEKLLIPNYNESVVLNSNLYYADGCSGILYKSNLDGSSAVALGDGTTFDDLFYRGGSC